MYSVILGRYLKATAASTIIVSMCGALAQTIEVPNASPQRCQKISELANSVMEARHSGTPMSQLIKNERNDVAERINNQLVSNAYSSPRMTSASGIRRSIEDFENETYRSCYSQISATPVANASSGTAAYDPAKYCQEISRISGGSSQIELACRQMEQQALKNLINMERTGKAEKYCHGIGATAGGSYRIKEACLKQEQAAAASLP